MRRGQEYIVGLQTSPTIEPREGGWALIRYPDRNVAVSPVVSSQSPWAASVHIFALEDSPDPTLERDELVYRNEEGEGESRIIVSFSQLG